METIDAFIGFKFLRKHFDANVEVIAKYALLQKQRIRGKWVISFAILQRKHREICKRVIGKDLIIINLKLDKASQYKNRIEKRHGENISQNFSKFLTNMSQNMQEISVAEENTFQINITENMTQEDVLAKVLQIIEY